MEKLKEAFNRYLQDRHTLSDLHLIQHHFNQDGGAEQLRTLIEAELDQEVGNTLDRRVDLIVANVDRRLPMAIEELQEVSYTIPFYRSWIFRIAAVLLLISGAGLYFYTKQAQSPGIQVQKLADILPAGNKAILKLADGSTVVLDSTNHGKIATQAGVDIITSNDGSIIYETAEKDNTSLTGLYNTIQIPNGGKYKVCLPDGSTVWLNSASTLKYPVSFNAATERKVELTGEAYFSVAHNKAQPFIVKTAGQEVKVLGTEFNINAYPNEHRTITTLLKGSVQVIAGKPFIIKPGQQTVLDARHLRIEQADTEGATGWKNGLFLFYNRDLPSIMREIERWYDVEIDMATVPNEQVYGEISREVGLQKVLAMLATSGNYKFKIEGRRIMLEK